MSERMSRRAFLAFASACYAAGPALAQSPGPYPNRQIQLIVPYPAGGAVDLAARLVAEKLRLDFGQPVVVENRPGANGMVGAASVARAQPDGYTLMMAPREVFGINPILMPQQATDGTRDFAYIGGSSPRAPMSSSSIPGSVSAASASSSRSRSNANSPMRASARAAWRISISRRWREGSA